MATDVTPSRRFDRLNKVFQGNLRDVLEESLTGHAELDAGAFANWLKERRAQIERGELMYIAHQMDFLAKV